MLNCWVEQQAMAEEVVHCKHRWEPKRSFSSYIIQAGFVCIVSHTHMYFMHRHLLVHAIQTLV